MITSVIFRGHHSRIILMSLFLCLLIAYLFSRTPMGGKGVTRLQAVYLARVFLNQQGRTLPVIYRIHASKYDSHRPYWFVMFSEVPYKPDANVVVYVYMDGTCRVMGL